MASAMRLPLPSRRAAPSRCLCTPSSSFLFTRSFACYSLTRCVTQISLANVASRQLLAVAASKNKASAAACFVELASPLTSSLACSAKARLSSSERASERTRRRRKDPIALAARHKLVPSYSTQPGELA
ncbi:unnamed protein product [Soboliphyme baturini]|uniref:Secreted protein n=1 Tax=Soboliphyme baturini TaxID=241478 RepID=A0A183IKS2_9BILA|nr:unnamed protein product [Soboliphyme baturini]